MNGTMLDHPLTVTHFLERARRLHAGRTVVTHDGHGRTQHTYQQWADRTARLMGALHHLGVAEDAAVGTFAWNSHRHLELYFAVPCSGRVLHTINVRLHPDQLRYVIDDAQDEAIFVDRSLVNDLAPILPDLAHLRHLIIMDDGSNVTIPRLSGIAVHDHDTLVDTHDPVATTSIDERRAASICYTSGTTGLPKGVVYTHRSTFLHTMSALTVDGLGIHEHDRVLPVVPMFHANAWGLGHAAVASGADLILPGRDLSGPTIARHLADEQISVAAGVPTIWLDVLAHLVPGNLGALRRLIVGGSAVPASLSEAYRDVIGLPITHAWGMTETSPVGSVCHLSPELAALPETGKARQRTSIGRQVPGIELRIADIDTGRELPWDGAVQGELQARGPWVTAGYHRQPDAPTTRDGWLRTGDVATIDEHGYVWLRDRLKDVIKSGGEWISSVELENEIMAHPNVAECAVVAIPDERWGERPLACVVPTAGAAPTVEDIRDHLEGRVARFWLPDRIELLQTIPRTSVGKFAKQQLRHRFASACTTPGT